MSMCMLSCSNNYTELKFSLFKKEPGKIRIKEIYNNVMKRIPLELFNYNKKYHRYLWTYLIYLITMK